MKRRKALENILYVAGTLIVLPAALSSCEEDNMAPDLSGGTGNTGGGGSNNQKLVIDLSEAKYSALTAVGGSIIENNIIVARTGTDTFVALSSICTHQGCTVSYNANQNNFPCPCHGSVFNAQGSVLAGPANSPLKSYPVSLSGDILTIG